MFNKFILSIIFIIVILFCVIFQLTFHSLVKEQYKGNNINTNLAFYTCFYGSNHNPAFQIPQTPSEKYDCYYFSNNKDLLNKLTGTKWIPVFDDKLVTEDVIQSCMEGKHVKVVPNDFIILQKYDYLCFLDSKLDKVSETFVEELIDKFFIQKNYALLLRQHVFIIEPNIWNEYNESMKQERYVLEKEKYDKYINNQLSKGLSETTSYHAQCGFLVLNMKHPRISEINNTWFSHINECGIQDQISFFFVKQLFENDIYAFTEIPFE